MILSIIAIEITHWSRFTLLLLLRIQRFMWRNHVATWAYTNNSGRNVGFNKIRFKSKRRQNKLSIVRKFVVYEQYFVIASMFFSVSFAIGFWNSKAVR